MVAEAREGRMLRRGLPRVAGGDPWPPETPLPASEGPVDDTAAAAPVHPAPDAAESDAVAGGVDAAVGAADGSAAGAAPAAGATTGGDDAGADAAADVTDFARVAAPADAAPEDPLRPGGSGAAGVEADGESTAGSGGAADAGVPNVRRGLPRIPGGEPWPPADAVPADAVPAVGSGAESPAAAAVAGAAGGRTGVAKVADARRIADAPSNTPKSAAAAPAPAAAAVTDGRAGAPVAAPADAATDAGTTSGPAPGIRRGLPRAQGGEPWPPADTVPADTGHTTSSPSAAADHAQAPVTSPSADDGHDHDQTLGHVDPARPASAPEAASTAEPAPAEASAPPASTAVAPTGSVLARDLSTPLAGPRTVWNGRAPRRIPAAPATPAAASARPRPTWTQGIALLFGAAALGVLAGAAVALVRALLSLPALQDFLATYPGEYTPAVAVEPGFAPWVGWQHFFNAFLMVLIIRSGLRIRHEKRPTAFWTPRNNPKGKTSLTIWFHQALDVLWLVNGVIFVVLLFVTGHWVRIVPTSWEVIPNALSATLQYVSFDWPHENGWNNYNSLQQLAYFATVFIAAPLAAVTGFRMSGMWPKKAERLSKAYPVEWARKLHFPVMIYFVIFIVAHVALVMLTGFLRNLNHMYAAQDAVTWTGFWVFIASLVVMAIGWVAARPVVIAPIARLFGNVSGR